MTESLPLVYKPELDGQVKSIEDDGYVYFPSVLSPDEIAKLRDAMDRLEPSEEGFDRIQSHDGTYLDKHILNCFNRDPIFLQYLDKPGVIDVAQKVMGHPRRDNMIPCHLIGMTSWVTGPGRPDQDLHTDWAPINLPQEVLTDPRVKIPIFIATAHFYLDDMYEELGPTKFIPGSHMSGRSPKGDTHWNGMSEKSILCKAGDVVMFRSEVWHRGTANRSDQNRYLLQVHYANRMISQKFPPYLNKFQFNPDILSKTTPRQRRLLGDHEPSNYD